MAETLLKIENLTKEYEGQKILDGIHLEVKKGDVSSIWQEHLQLFVQMLKTCMRWERN